MSFTGHYKAVSSVSTQANVRTGMYNAGEQNRKILIVEDEADIIDYLTLYCEAEGYKVLVAGDGPAALSLFKNEPPDLVLLDLMLPGLDGLEVCRRIRSVSNTPIIMVTARREEVDKLLGLETGADDYLTKPFSPRELMARIRVLFRRLDNLAAEFSLNNTSSSSVRESKNINLGRLLINLDTREVRYENQPIPTLTIKEFELLVTLARQPGWVYSKSELEEALYGGDYLLESRAIGVHISNLRNKLPNSRLIETVYGIGYKLSREAV